MTSRKRPVIGDALREARVAIRFTQTAFADELGISRRTLSRWEQGDGIPDEFQRPWIVRTVMGFDGEIAKRLAENIGVAVSPASGGTIASNAYIGAALILGVDVGRFRDELVKLVRVWRTAGLTLDDVAKSLGA